MSWEDFERRMHELSDLKGVIGLLGWDEETYTPSQGRAARGRQTGTLEAIQHRWLVDPALEETIAGLLADTSLEEERRVMVQRVDRERRLAARVPESLVKRFAEARSASLSAWQAAKTEDDFASFAPHLETIVSILRERADALGSSTGNRYDALLEEYEPGMTEARLTPVLDALVKGLVPIVEELAEGTAPDASFLAKKYDDAGQWDFTMRVLRDLGFALDRGRQDRSAHPFTATSSEDDVRVTTKILEDHLTTSIFSTIHECGHGLYEQGFDSAHVRTSLAAAPSMGLHESQSRLWENQIGRSLPFWRRYLPVLAEHFGAQLEGVTPEQFYGAVNRVERSFIRTEADEVTYNLHIALRYELERALLSGDLAPKDLPGAWNEKMEKYLGVTPPDDAHGCLQDIHWAWGAIGYFPTYSIGNLYSAQLLAAYEAERPELWDDVEAGDFARLLSWLREKVHRLGYRYDAEEIVRRATGSGLQVAPLVDALRAKYRPLYGL
ncbi:MAG: carboxypeptidase M32 [Deltaproteobacteria bacterium]